MIVVRGKSIEIRIHPTTKLVPVRRDHAIVFGPEDLGRPKSCRPTVGPELAHTRGAQVADPLGLTAS